MPALLLAGLRGAAGKPLTRETVGPEMATMPVIILEGLAKKHGGQLLPSSAGFCLMTFEKPAAALSCALAAQARFTEYNRGKPDDKLACVRLAVHWTGAPAPAAIPEKDGKTLTLMQDVTPPGRVYVTRPVFTQSHGSQACAFIPMGIEYFSGLSDPLDLLEAVPIVGATRTISPLFSSAGGPTDFRPVIARPATAAAPPALEPASGVFDAFASPVVLGAAAALTVPLFLLSGALLSILSPLDGLGYLFHSAGHALFGFGGSETAAAMGALGLLTAAPLALLVRCWSSASPLGAHAALFWLGQSLVSVAGHVGAAGGADLETYAGCVKNDGILLAKSLGVLAHYNAWARSAGFAGCFLIACALAGFWVHLKSKQGQAVPA